MVAFGSTAPSDDSTERAVVKEVATGLEAIVTTADVLTVIVVPRSSLNQRAG